METRCWLWAGYDQKFASSLSHSLLLCLWIRMGAWNERLKTGEKNRKLIELLNKPKSIKKYTAITNIPIPIIMVIHNNQTNLFRDTRTLAHHAVWQRKWFYDIKRAENPFTPTLKNCGILHFEHHNDDSDGDTMDFRMPFTIFYRCYRPYARWYDPFRCELRWHVFDP